MRMEKKILIREATFLLHLNGQVGHRLVCRKLRGVRKTQSRLQDSQGFMTELISNWCRDQ